MKYIVQVAKRQTITERGFFEIEALSDEDALAKGKTVAYNVQTTGGRVHPDGWLWTPGGVDVTVECESVRVSGTGRKL